MIVASASVEVRTVRAPPERFGSDVQFRREGR